MTVTWCHMTITRLSCDSPGLGTPKSPALGMLHALTDHISFNCIMSERMKLLSRESWKRGRRDKDEGKRLQYAHLSLGIVQVLTSVTVTLAS